MGSYGHNAGGAREFNDAFYQLREGSQPSYYYGAQLTFPLGNTGARATLQDQQADAGTVEADAQENRADHHDYD